MSLDNRTGTPRPTADPGDKSPEELEREVDAQRSSIGQIVDALEKKMSPGQWVDQALAYTRQNGGEFIGNLGQNVRRNPVPTVLMSVSLAWLMLGQRQSSQGPQPLKAEPLSDSIAGIKNTLHDQALGLKEKAGQIMDSANGLDLKAQGQRLQSGLTDMLHQQPMALAGIAVALGAVLGQNLPPVERKLTQHTAAATGSAGLG